MHHYDTHLAAPALRALALPFPFGDGSRLPGLLRDLPLIGWLFNIGGPMSRRRSERICSTLVGNTASSLGWPRRLVVALHFPHGVDPLEYAEAVLKRAGYDAPEQAAQQRTDLPTGTYYCHAQKLSATERQLLAVQSDDEFLRAALILGLCGPNFYARDRALIWSAGRLTRTVGLFKTTGFYED